MPTRLPAKVYAAYEGSLHGVIGLCGRCASQVGDNPSGRQRKRLEAVCSKALKRPDRYWCETFEDQASAELVCGMLGSPSMVLDVLKMLGWGVPATTAW